MYALVWLLFAAFVGATMTANILAFGHRDAAAVSPDVSVANRLQLVSQHWRDSDAQVREQLRDQYFWTLLEKGDSNQAAAILPAPQSGDQRDDAVLRKLATARWLKGDYDGTQWILEHFAQQDSRNATASERDFNNLGVLHYCRGMQIPDAERQQKEFALAKGCFEKAHGLLLNAPTSNRIGLLENEALLAEALKEYESSRRLHKQADDVRRQLKVNVPTLLR